MCNFKIVIPTEANSIYKYKNRKRKILNAILIYLLTNNVSEMISSLIMKIYLLINYMKTQWEI